MKKTILLADDSVTIRKVVELTFMDENYELVPAATGEEALDSFAGRKPGFDLVIADVHMPGPNGYEVCRQVKKASPSTPVLLLVGTFEQFDDQAAVDAGADGHLKKPFDSQDLLRLVRELLDRAGSEPQQTVSSAQAEPDPAATPPTGRDQGAGAESPAEQAVEAHPVEALPATASAPSTGADGSHRGAELELSDESVDRIARRVVELLSEEAIRDVAWEVIPDLAEVVIKERLNELESEVE